MSHHKQKGRGSEKGALSAAEAEQYAKMGVTPGRRAGQKPAGGGNRPVTRTGPKGDGPKK